MTFHTIFVSTWVHRIVETLNQRKLNQNNLINVFLRRQFGSYGHLIGYTFYSPALFNQLISMYAIYVWLSAVVYLTRRPDHCLSQICLSRKITKVVSANQIWYILITVINRYGSRQTLFIVFTPTLVLLVWYFYTSTVCVYLNTYTIKILLFLFYLFKWEDWSFQLIAKLIKQKNRLI